jgi:hypothetical protein
MKKLILIVGVLIMAHASYSQIFSWGIKGGVNSSKISFDDFNVDGNMTVKTDYLPGGAYADELTTTLPDGSTIINPSAINYPKLTFTPSSYDMGYHFGAFARIKLLGIFIQPELIFSQTNTTINIQNTDNLFTDVTESATSIKYTNFDIPLMVGVKFGPLRLNAGPVASFKLGNSSDAASEEIKQMTNSFTAVTQKATFGGQAGVGLDILGKITLDVRYEFPLSKLGDNITLGDYTYSTDQRASQFLGSIGIMF